MSNEDKVRKSISLSGTTNEYLEYIAEVYGITHNEAIGRAIRTEAYLLKAIKEEGSIIILRTRGQLDKEVVLR